jgi:hypothetical protein
MCNPEQNMHMREGRQWEPLRLSATTTRGTFSLMPCSGWHDLGSLCPVEGWCSPHTLGIIAIGHPLMSGNWCRVSKKLYIKSSLRKFWLLARPSVMALTCSACKWHAKFHCHKFYIIIGH